jgi:hypothetical protein
MSSDAPPTSLVIDRSATDQYPHKWKTGIVGACCKEPSFFAYSCVCFTCSNVTLRRKALNYDMSKYRCFQHHFFRCCGRCIPGQRACPCCCLMLEAHCCPILSSLATRHTIQDRLHVQSTCLEKCCLRAMCVCECLLCCVDKESCFCEVAHALGHMCLCVVLPCMNTQGYHELTHASGGQLNEALLA